MAGRRWTSRCGLVNKESMGAKEVEEYLTPDPVDDPGLGMPSLGMKLLLRQGWRRGQGLGKDNQGRRAPVEADRSRLGGQRHGLGFHTVPPPKK